MRLLLGVVWEGDAVWEDGAACEGGAAWEDGAVACEGDVAWEDGVPKEHLLCGPDSNISHAIDMCGLK